MNVAYWYIVIKEIIKGKTGIKYQDQKTIKKIGSTLFIYWEDKYITTYQNMERE